MPDPLASNTGTEPAVLDQLRIDHDSPEGAADRRGLVGWAIALLLLAGCGYYWFARQRIPEVRTVTARALPPASSRTVLNASGYVVARREATVSSKVTGKVIEVLVEEGMSVAENQILARLDASNLEASRRLSEAQCAAAKSGLAETEVRLDEAQREWRRVAHLNENRIATQADLDRANAEVKSLEARLSRQRAEVEVALRQSELWQQQIDDTVIRAPFAGIATSKNAQPGEMISPVSAGGGFTRTGICTVVDMNSLEIEVDVNESNLNLVEPRQAVAATLDAYPNWKIPCQVIAIIPTADRQKATVRVRIGFSQLDPRILPQMGVKVSFFRPADEAGQGTTVAVPKSALKASNGRTSVLLIRGDRAASQAVMTSATNANEVTIISGLTGGEKLIVEGPKHLSDGMRVREAMR